MVSLSRHISSRERRLLIPSTFSAGDSVRLYWVQAWSANRLLNYCKLAGSVSALRPLRLQLRAYVGGQISPLAARVATLARLRSSFAHGCKR